MKTLSLLALTALFLSSAAFAAHKGSHATKAMANAKTVATADQNGEVKKDEAKKEVKVAKKKIAKRKSRHQKAEKKQS